MTDGGAITGARGGATVGPGDEHLDWLDKGTATFLAAAERGDPRGPSLLPGWERAHVLAHVARNADALVNLCRWASTGVETPMYASSTARLEQIEVGASRDREELLEDLKVSAERLAGALATMSPQAWSEVVRSATGREIRAAEIVWMRDRELWIHAVDLDAGVGFEELPPPMVGTLLDEVTRLLSSRPDCPEVELRSDGGRRWRLGAGESAVAVEGPASALAAWVVGRSAGTGLRLEAPAGSAFAGVATGHLPALPAWL